MSECSSSNTSGTTNSTAHPLTISPDTCCLCVGSGATSQFVGDWASLLGKLMERRMVSNWLRDGRPLEDIAPCTGEGCFGGFFKEEGALELGEFLLADDSIPVPGSFGLEDEAWQERLFAQQVSDVVQQSVQETLSGPCAAKSCPHSATCAIAKEGDHQLAQVYEAYLAAGRACENFGTAMAIVELCLSGKARYVITYNFDTVIEQTLFGALTTGCPDVVSEVREIHVWTFGSSQASDPRQNNAEACAVIYHQGTVADDPESLVAPGSVHFFHVHGVAADPWLSDVTEQLVFSQHSYDLYLASPLNWGNQVLEYFCSRYDLLAVGFSGTDANFRAFAQHHYKAGAGVNARMGGVGGTRHGITLLKARQPYRGNIERALRRGLDEEHVEELTSHLREYCAEMVANYYSNDCENIEKTMGQKLSEKQVEELSSHLREYCAGMMKYYYPSFREIIEKAMGQKLSEKQVKRLVPHFLKYCTEMVTNYYFNYYHARIEWVDNYVDVAAWLCDAACEGAD